MSPAGTDLPPLDPKIASALILMRCPECRSPCSAQTRWIATTFRTTWHCSTHGEVTPGPSPDDVA